MLNSHILEELLLEFGLLTIFFLIGIVLALLIVKEDEEQICTKELSD